MLSHPLVIETKAFMPFVLNLLGLISAYVSSFDSRTFTASFPNSTSFNKFGRSLYASGPTTKSTIFSSTKNFSFNLSAMHPSTPTFKFFLFFLIALILSSFFLTVNSAFSLIEHVLSKIKSDSCNSLV